MLNCIAHDSQVGVQRRFSSAHNRFLIVSGGNRSEDHDDCDHNHQFNHRKSALRFPTAARAIRFVFIPAYHYPTPIRAYQSEYLVPFSAVPDDLVNTSKTSWPPQEPESVSSWTARMPQS